ncbi:PP2C family serine/threonine-protein phosphatase [Pedobacter sp. BMA]|uniref:PP2C family protein-serine/threonine phosphatase n=1 Tax=Pedobacter sp. BMA TaxID=1663685 RepID=UPI00069EC0C6|nr:protein phosphatase 2C domain-containing protein [Pedobacter sp. BMA]
MNKYFFGITDTGKSRDNNEDSFIATSLTEDRLILASVIDGVGGYHGGEVAAAIAKEEILKQFKGLSVDPIAEMINAFNKTNEVIAVRKKTEKELSEMACVATLVLADIEHNQFYYAHVGDTRLYLLRDGSLVKISKDHSFVGFLEDSGRLDETAAMQHPKRNEINKAIGFSDQMSSDESYIETGQSPFLPGDLLLICSDGLTDMVNKQDIITLLLQGDDLSKKAENLVAMANENGGRDNITVVLVQNNKKLQQAAPTKPRPAQQTATTAEPTMQSPINNNHHSPSTAPAKPKRNFWFTALVFLCLILLGATVFLFLQTRRTPEQASPQVLSPTTPVRNSQEKLLQDAFDNAVGDTVVLSDSIFKSPVLISDTLRIRKDTLYILARGLVLQADTGYKGAALSMLTPAKLLGLDSLQFKGFANAVSISNQALLLKNVRFTSCKLHVNNNLNFPDQQMVSAGFPNIVVSSNTSPKSTDSKNGAK